MAISSLAPVGGGVTPTSNSTANSLTNVVQGGESSFLQLLVAQLQNQDPLNPVSGTDFTSQLAQFSTVDSLTQLNTNFATQLKLQELSQGANLIGKTISYLQTGAANAQQGQVSSVQINNGQLQLSVGPNTVTLDQVLGIVSN